jgi:hypothetical protein
LLRLTVANESTADQPKLRRVDPYARRGRVYLTVCRLAATPAGLWLSRNVAWKLDPHLLRLSRGRFASTGPVASAVLETRGARTGRPRRTTTLYFNDGDRVVIIASKMGLPEHPTSSSVACRSGPRSSGTRPSGSGCGISRTACSPSSPTTAAGRPEQGE